MHLWDSSFDDPNHPGDGLFTFLLYFCRRGIYCYINCKCNYSSSSSLADKVASSGFCKSDISKTTDLQSFLNLDASIMAPKILFIVGRICKGRVHILSCHSSHYMLIQSKREWRLQRPLILCHLPSLELTTSCSCSLMVVVE